MLLIQLCQYEKETIYFSYFLVSDYYALTVIYLMLNNRSYHALLLSFVCIFI